MATQPELSVRDFFALGNEAAAHTAELRIRLAEAGVSEPRDEPLPDEPA